MSLFAAAAADKKLTSLHLFGCLNLNWLNLVVLLLKWMDSGAAVGVFVHRTSQF